MTFDQFRRFADATNYTSEIERLGGAVKKFNSATKKVERSQFVNWRTPGYSTSDDLPVTYVTWDDAVAFCNWLSTQERLAPCLGKKVDAPGTWTLLPAGDGYRLPTEAQWEYACRAGTTTAFSSGDNQTQLEQYAWCSNPGSDRSPQAVAKKRPNPFGIFDMHGNVREWCLDASRKYAEQPPAIDPLGALSGAEMSSRGGDWYYGPFFARSADRFANNVWDRFPTHGFRVVRVLPSKAMPSELASSQPVSLVKTPQKVPAKTASPFALPMNPGEMNAAPEGASIATAKPSIDPAAQDDPIAAELASAKARYAEEIAAFRDEAERYFLHREETAQKSTNESQLAAIKTERNAFDESGTLPSKVVFRSHGRNAEAHLVEAYQNVILKYRKANLESRAVEVEKDLETYWKTNHWMAALARATPFASRRQQFREMLLAQNGGNGQTESAVAAALNWIARHQSNAGNWSIAKYTAGCKDDTCMGSGKVESDTAATAMALLPFLAAGHTQSVKGPYQKTIHNGLMWLVRAQQRDGSLISGAGNMYSHGLAAICLCEAYGLTRDAKIGQAAQASIKFIESAQNKNDGGWRYTPGQPGDTSVVGWQVMAMKAALMSGLQVDSSTENGARKFLKLASAKSKNGGAFAYQPNDPPNISMTSVGLLCSQYIGLQRDDPAMLEGLGSLMRSMPSKTGARNVYYWYYGTQVMHNLPGPEWDAWNNNMRQVLVDSQIKEGCATGSWNPLKPVPDSHGDTGGRLMITSFSTLILQVYYRYPPLYPPDNNDDSAEKIAGNQPPAFAFEGAWLCRHSTGWSGVRTFAADHTGVDFNGDKINWAQDGMSIIIRWPGGGFEKLEIDPNSRDKLTGVTSRQNQGCTYERKK